MLSIFKTGHGQHMDKYVKNVNTSVAYLSFYRVYKGLKFLSAGKSKFFA